MQNLQKKVLALPEECIMNAQPTVWQPDLVRPRASRRRAQIRARANRWRPAGFLSAVPQGAPCPFRLMGAHFIGKQSRVFPDRFVSTEWRRSSRFPDRPKASICCDPASAPPLFRNRNHLPRSKRQTHAKADPKSAEMVCGAGEGRTATDARRRSTT
jgi:hypothetical protein